MRLGLSREKRIHGVCQRRGWNSRTWTWTPFQPPPAVQARQGRIGLMSLRGHRAEDRRLRLPLLSSNKVRGVPRGQACSRMAWRSHYGAELHGRARRTRSSLRGLEEKFGRCNARLRRSTAVRCSNNSRRPPDDRLVRYAGPAPAQPRSATAATRSTPSNSSGRVLATGRRRPRATSGRSAALMHVVPAREGQPPLAASRGVPGALWHLCPSASHEACRDESDADRTRALGSLRKRSRVGLPGARPSPRHGWHSRACTRSPAVPQL